jgi:hypothetical protein
MISYVNRCADINTVSVDALQVAKGIWIRDFRQSTWNAARKRLGDSLFEKNRLTSTGFEHPSKSSGETHSLERTAQKAAQFPAIPAPLPNRRSMQNYSW